MTTLHLPRSALIVLVGPAGSGKSTFAARHFRQHQVLASDAYRAAVSGDPADQSVNREAFRRLHADLERRMAAGELTVVDATNVQPFARRSLLTAASRHGRPTVALVLALPVDLCLERNANRPGRRVPDAVVRQQDRWLRSSLGALPDEGYALVMVLGDPAAVARVRVRRARPTRDTKKRPEGTAPGPLMQSPEPSPGP